MTAHEYGFHNREVCAECYAYAVGYRHAVREAALHLWEWAEQVNP